MSRSPAELRPALFGGTPCKANGFACRLCFLEAEDERIEAVRGRMLLGAGGSDWGFGGPGAIGTVPGLARMAVWPEVELVGVVAEPMEPVMELGDSDSCVGVLVDSNVEAVGWTREFLRLAFFAPRAPTGIVLAVPRLRFLMMSVLSERGRTTPWSLRNRPHALQSG